MQVTYRANKIGLQRVKRGVTPCELASYIWKVGKVEYATKW